MMECVVVFDGMCFVVAWNCLFDGMNTKELGLTRWPYRDLQSLKKKIDTLNKQLAEDIDFETRKKVSKAR